MASFLYIISHWRQPVKDNIGSELFERLGSQGRHVAQALYDFTADSLRTIGAYAFAYCASLRTLQIGVGVREIGESAFSDCTALTEAVLPDSVTRLGSGVFNRCTALERVHIPSTVTDPAPVLYGCKSLATVCSDAVDCPVQVYAEEKGLTFLVCDGHGLPGDADGSGTVDLRDVVQIERYLAGGWDAQIDRASADVNDDGSIDLRDAVLLRRYLAGGWDVVLL